MTLDGKKRIDLEAWLEDLKRLGGEARTLGESGSSLRSLIDPADLDLFQEATRRLVVSLGRHGPLYGLPVLPGWDAATLAGAASAGEGTGPLLTVPGISGSEDATTMPRGASLRHLPDHGITGQSESIRRVRLLIEKAAACALPVLIQGESGTGKELVARAIHRRSNRQGRRFFSENCSALSESLLESELFGHVRGAFTGADRDRKGILELADGGTLFLDEIGDMSVRMQSKLLRALQEREFRPVGGRDTIRVNVRVISATNRSLVALVKTGGFREDLFYRVNVITIDMPPLRDRREDIPLLIGDFLDRLNGDSGLPRREVTQGAMQLLVGYEWPGNVRELENVVQRAVALSDDHRIGADSLPERIRHQMVTDEAADYSTVSKSGEHLMIEKALHMFEGDKTRAARYIGWSRPKIYRRMRLFGIPNRFGRR
jgi:DNA-binding NtrC family response regulator